MTRKRVIFPIASTPICGHGNGLGDLAIGREQGFHKFEGKNTNYYGAVEYGACSICNKAREKEIEVKALELEAKL